MDTVSDHKPKSIRPRIIIHGGAGNITRNTLPTASYQAYRHALLDILRCAHSRLHTSPDASALDVATYAVSLLEDCPLFNAGHGAVYTRAGTHELEASVMVSHGYRKRGVGVMQVARAKNPILLAKEMLLRGERDDGGGAQGHCQLAGETCDRLAEEWGLDLVAPSYYWTKKRWDEHRRGLGLSHSQEEYDKMKREADAPSRCVRGVGQMRTIAISDDPSWDEHEYLPQGTVGAVVLDSRGTVAVATSTGGLTNKLPGRIGDTPTIGAGFFAEQWDITSPIPPAPSLFDTLSDAVGSCLPAFAGYSRLPTRPHEGRTYAATSTRAVAMSGTGNGDSFLRLSAVRTAAAMARFTSVNSSALSHPRKDLLSLQEAVSAVAGLNGMLQRSAGDRWHKIGEGEGGVIGIDLVDGVGRVVFDFNCGGMFRAWYDDKGKPLMMVFREEY